MKYLYVLAGIISFAILGASFLNLPDVQKINADVNISEDGKLGFNTDDDAVHFGSVPRSNGAERKIVLFNEKDFEQRIRIGARGEMAGWLSLSESSFVMPPKTKKEVVVWVSVPGNAPAGMHFAEIAIMSRRKWF